VVARAKEAASVGGARSAVRRVGSRQASAGGSLNASTTRLQLFTYRRRRTYLVVFWAGTQAGKESTEAGEQERSGASWTERAVYSLDRREKKRPTVPRLARAGGEPRGTNQRHLARFDSFASNASLDHGVSVRSLFSFSTVALVLLPTYLLGIALIPRPRRCRCLPPTSHLPLSLLPSASFKNRVPMTRSIAIRRRSAALPGVPSLPLIPISI
jgi:hypothetical protein